MPVLQSGELHENGAVNGDAAPKNFIADCAGASL
jgi:hypothetical protein